MSDAGDGGVALRAVRDGDLGVFFAHQQEREACWMAAFTSPDPSDRAAFDAHWARIRGRDDVCVRAIEADGVLVGHIASFWRGDAREVTYWLGQASWGRGLATAALRRFMAECEPARPLFARVAEGNAGSEGVLRKCGFVVEGHDKGFAHGRGEEVAERIWVCRR